MSTKKIKEANPGLLFCCRHDAFCARVVTALRTVKSHRVSLEHLFCPFHASVVNFFTASAIFCIVGKKFTL